MLDLKQKLRSLYPFNHLSEKELQDLAQNSEIIHIRRRQILFEEGKSITNLFVVLNGSFKIIKNGPHFKEVILNFLSRGEFLGIALAGLRHPLYPATIQALEDSVVLSFSREYFFKKLLPREFIHNVVNQQIGERFLELQNDRCMEKMRCPQKLADFLLRLWERQSSNDRTIRIPLSRKDIAERIGAQSETVVRVLSVWTKKDLIGTKGKIIELKNTAELIRLRDSNRKAQELHVPI